MKKVLLAAMLLLGATASRAQYPNITIVNNTTCDVYLELNGDLFGSNCTKQNYTSPVFSVPPGTTSYTPATVPGGMNCGTCSPTSLGASDIIWSALVYKGYACAGPNTTTFLLQKNACTSNTTAGFTDYDANCKPCSPITNVAWTDMGTYIELKFY